MHKLTTSYLGLNLKSPVIVSSSRLTSNIDNLKTAEENGAGAVVLKSLFEEQIMYYINQLPLKEGFPEADDYISAYARSHSVEEYLNLIRKAKTDFSGKISDAGADALEINAFFMPLDRKMSSSEAEKLYLKLVERVVEKLTIPVAMKIGTRFSNVLYMIDQFYARGVKGVVMFNRFYEPDIDIRRMQIVPAQIFSSGEEKRYVLRWIAMASAQGIRIDISASTGVKNGEDVIKYLLAGADTVQVCSVLYEKGLPYLAELNSELTKWMTERDYKTIGEFKGKLNWKNTEKPVVFERTQFMKYFSSID
jgi:dihydroorotate dehydrogenase (fumarate)